MNFSNFDTRYSIVFIYRIFTELLLLRNKYEGPFFFLAQSNHEMYFDDEFIYYNLNRVDEYYLIRNNDNKKPTVIPLSDKNSDVLCPIWDLLTDKEHDYLAKKEPALLEKLIQIKIACEKYLTETSDITIEKQQIQLEKIRQTQFGYIKKYFEGMIETPELKQID